MGVNQNDDFWVAMSHLTNKIEMFRLLGGTVYRLSDYLSTFSFTRLRRKELPITDRELVVIATTPIMG